MPVICYIPSAETSLLAPASSAAIVAAAVVTAASGESRVESELVQPTEIYSRTSISCSIVVNTASSLLLPMTFPAACFTSVVALAMA